MRCRQAGSRGRQQGLGAGVGGGAEAVGAERSRGVGCGGSRQVTSDMRKGAWRKSKSQPAPTGCITQALSPVTCRTKLLDVVSEEVLPSDLLNRPFLLLYLPWRGGEGTRVTSEKCFPSSSPTRAGAVYYQPSLGTLCSTPILSFSF